MFHKGRFTIEDLFGPFEGWTRLINDGTVGSVRISSSIRQC